MKDPLFGNKAAAAVLLTALLLFGVPIMVETFLSGAHHEPHKIGEDHVDPANPFGFHGYPVAVSFEGGGAVEAAPEIDLGTLLAAADPAKGKNRALICTTCHTLTKGGANGTGPHLWDVVGRPMGGEAGFAYSNALKTHGGVWTYESLDAYLKNSQSYMPGTAMAQKFSKAEQRAEILAYLQTLSDNPVPFPAPAPVEAAPAAGDGSHGEEGADATGGAEAAHGEDHGDKIENVLQNAGDSLDGMAKDALDAAQESVEDAAEHAPGH